ncbi:SIR2 family protein [Chryseobacterium sp. MFBS3-17]|uniref:SIR2 family protein n=1 Tax=Chryseobacterium sp. MFBS3-17 TaxID=2886689 RepID=UPI001D0EB5F2|nr:SIR2 family protein [Chryseobacterium sp. MFBS3-17]MCC2590040.1 SIR2 family protein [Chryseobacterium sp. MFBS3-17]
MMKHDPSEYIRGIQQILISDKKKIGFLFGAGSSLARKSDNSLTVPAIGAMTKEIVKEAGEKQASYGIALEQIEVELGSDNFNIETLLSKLELKLEVIGDSTLNSLTKEDFQNLIQFIKKCVREKVSVHLENDKIVHKDIVKDLVQTDFANWIGQAERKYPIEIFTTNYDFLFELGLEYKEVPYYDGFCGSLRAFFNPESVEDFSFLSKQTKLWKIHGSLGWHYDTDTEKILRVSPDDEDILIYPSTLKYKDSKKQPYESLLDRLSNFIKQDDSILITCGYSWGDEHINSRIVSALKTNTTSHVIALYYDRYDKIDEQSKVVKIGFDNPKISIYASNSAVIGCNFGNWKIKSEPSKEDSVNIDLYFDEDGALDEDAIKGTETKGEEDWKGTGEFVLPDFGKLVKFLNSMVNENEIKKIGENVKK